MGWKLRRNRNIETDLLLARVEDVDVIDVWKNERGEREKAETSSGNKSLKVTPLHVGQRYASLYTISKLHATSRKE